MNEEILAALTADQRAILAPHMERFSAAEREYSEAQKVLLLAVRTLLPALAQDGVKFDTNRGVLWRPQASPAPQEGDDGAA